MNSYGEVQRRTELKRYGMEQPRLAWSRGATAETGYDENSYGIALIRIATEERRIEMLRKAKEEKRGEKLWHSEAGNRIA